jgi:hypothetical protein
MRCGDGLLTITSPSSREVVVLCLEVKIILIRIIYLSKPG